MNNDNRNNRPRRPFVNRFNRTRIIRSEGMPAVNYPGNAGAKAPSAGTVAENGHRIVMGRGARKLAPFRRPAANQFRARSHFGGNGNKRFDAGKRFEANKSFAVKHPPLPAKHIAGARMNVVRPDAARSMRRGPSAKPAVRREGDIVPALAHDSIRIIPLAASRRSART